MKTLLMRAWRRLAPGLALAAALATAWAVREHVGQGEPSRWRPTRPLSNDWWRPRIWRRARGWTNRTCSDGRFPRPGRPVPAWIRWRRKHCGAVLSADIDAGEIILPASAGPTRRARRRRRLRLAALPAGMRALNVTVADLGPLAGRLRVGDSVDVYASFVHDGKRNAAPVLLAAGPVRRRVGRRWRAGHGERHAGGPPEDALRFVAARQGGILTAMLRHRDDAVAVGDEDLADPAALQGMPAESPPAGGVVILYGDRQDGRAPRGGRPIRRRGRRGRRMALNRYRLAAMLGLCGCLAGVQAQTIPVELEVGKAGCCPIRACGAWRSATGRYCARPTPTGRKSSFWPRRGESSVHVWTDAGRPTAYAFRVVPAGAARQRAEVERCSRAFRRPGACVGGSIVIEATICPTRTAPASPRWPSAIRPCWTSRDRSAGTAWCCWTCRSWRSRPRACVSSA